MMLWFSVMRNGKVYGNTQYLYFWLKLDCEILYLRMRIVAGCKRCNVHNGD